MLVRSKALHGSPCRSEPGQNRQAQSGPLRSQENAKEGLGQNRPGSLISPTAGRVVFCPRALPCVHSIFTRQRRQPLDRMKQKNRIAKPATTYYAANRDRILKRVRAYQTANRGKILKQKAAYRAANRKSIAKYQAAYWAANRERIAAYRAKKRASVRPRTRPGSPPNGPPP